ncbi:hypothetical protein PAXRUDRAFT_155163 [Paxillus rubicundulus Ve08.2h10]|uniref:Uncharacterized protein n=1 Tax=Paxillus rubicundulus Ve08.2h10 TaxID=930991 RepID=A0A0D0CGI4_9AGAM|nr:hypothetical protein PAXRUDRAFT_155163 [Paxillus rubicundulus Ve08.2h10]
MPPHTVSINLKTHIPPLHCDWYSIKEICVLLDVKKTMVSFLMNLHARHGVVCNPHKYSHVVGHHCVLNIAGFSFISAVIAHHDMIYLDELQHELWAKCQVYTTLPTLLQAIQELDITYKAGSAQVLEHSNELNVLYMNHTAAEAPDVNMLMFVDKAVKDERTSVCRHG